MANYQPGAMDVADMLLTMVMARMDHAGQGGGDAPELFLSDGSMVEDASEAVMWNDATGLAHFSLRASDGTVYRVAVATELSV